MTETQFVQWWCPTCGTLNDDWLDDSDTPYLCEKCSGEFSREEVEDNKRED